MKYKKQSMSPITFIFILMIVPFVVGSFVTSVIFDFYEEKSVEEIVERCKAGNSFTVGGVEIHCGIIHTEHNMEAARYRQVKECIKLTKEWTNEYGQYNHFSTLKHHNEYQINE
jgi:hypothetical protein